MNKNIAIYSTQTHYRIDTHFHVILSANLQATCFIAELGVFAKKPIPRRVQFGPYVADLVSNTNMLCNPGFILKVRIVRGLQFRQSYVSM